MQELSSVAHMLIQKKNMSEWTQGPHSLSGLYIFSNTVKFCYNAI